MLRENGWLSGQRLVRTGNLNSPSQVTPRTAIADSEHHYKEIMKKQVRPLGITYAIYTLLKRLLFTALRTYWCSFTKDSLNTKPNCIQVVNELIALLSVYYVVIKKWLTSLCLCPFEEKQELCSDIAEIKRNSSLPNWKRWVYRNYINASEWNYTIEKWLSMFQHKKKENNSNKKSN